jgi:hypothetical protein
MMLFGDAPNYQRARDKALTALENLYLDASLPIYTGDRGKPDQIGTGFVLDCSSDAYFVTAAHVVDQCDENGLFIGLAPNFVAFAGSGLITKTNRPDRGDDRHDLAIFHLEPEMQATLAHVKMIPNWAVEWRSVPVNGHLYTAIGYPNSRNKKPHSQQAKVRATRLMYTNAATEAGVPTALAGLPQDGEHHILLPYDKRALDTSGAEVDAIAPRGLSGGPLWDLGRISSPSALESDGAPDIRLAGVVIELQDHKLICTRVTALKAMLEAISSSAAD